MNNLSAELGKQFEDNNVVILGETAEDYYRDSRKLDFVFRYLSLKPSSEVIDLTTRKSGLDSLIEYNDMVRSLHKHGFDYTVEHHEVARKFCKRGTV